MPDAIPTPLKGRSGALAAHYIERLPELSPEQQQRALEILLEETYVAGWTRGRRDAREF